MYSFEEEQVKTVEQGKVPQGQDVLSEPVQDEVDAEKKNKNSLQKATSLDTTTYKERDDSEGASQNLSQPIRRSNTLPGRMKTTAPLQSDQLGKLESV